MFNNPQLADVTYHPENEKSQVTQPKQTPIVVDSDYIRTLLHSMNETELLVTYAEIQSLIPSLALGELDMEQELVKQYRIASAFQTKALAGNEETNKKASALNACTAALNNLAKLQNDFYNAERLKEIEGKLIQALNKIPDQYTKEFFEWYEKSLEGFGRK